MDIINTANGPSIIGADKSVLDTYEQQTNAVRTFKVTLHCAKCKAEMELQPTQLMSYPPKFTYLCPVCKNKITKPEMYPHLDYEFEGEQKKTASQILV